MKFQLEKALGFNLGTTFFALGSLLTQNIHASGEDLTHKQVKLILFLGHYEGVKQQQLATILQKDKPSITKMVDILEKKGLVERKEDKEDRRNRLLFLTKKGTSLRAKLLPVVQKTISEATSVLSEAENAQLVELLTRVRDNIQSKLEK